MNHTKNPKKPLHKPVMLDEVLNDLMFKDVKSVFDGTLGLGGHAEAILEKYGSLEFYMGTDLDQQHLDLAARRLSSWEEKLHLFQKNFSEIGNIISEVQPTRPMVILLDLGICSNHVDDPAKGFSFEKEGPLHMAFDGSTGANAEKYLNTATVKELTDTFRKYGEEPLAHRLAHNVVHKREHQPLRTTADLRAVIEETVHPKNRKKALMRVFQAVRIVVNDEMGHLEKVLEESLGLMEKGDRLGIITYHSLEDGMVKKSFLQASKPVTQESLYSLHEVVEDPSFELVNRKPLPPTAQEIADNPRSRSAKLRMIQKTK